MLDIGANVGLTTLAAADHLSGGRILAVEASPRNCAALRANLARHEVGNALVAECALGSAPGTLRFFDNSAYGHVLTESYMAAAPAIEQRVTTLDALVAEHALPRVDFVKIDVEGYESEVLEGAPDTLARFDPLVLLEFNSWCMISCFDRSPRQFLDRLLALFPQLYVWRDGRLTDIRRHGPMHFLQAHLTEHRCIDDLVGCGAGRDLARLAAEPAGFLARMRSRIFGAE